MAWFWLIFSGLLEIVWIIGLKHTENFTKFWPSVWTIAVLIVGFRMLTEAVRVIPIGTAYAVWTGIGAVGTAIVGILFLGESREVIRLLCIGLIIAGVTGLKLSAQ